MTETSDFPSPSKRPDPDCGRCAGTGLTLTMDECPCGVRGVEIGPGWTLVAAEPVPEWTPVVTHVSVVEVAAGFAAPPFSLPSEAQRDFLLKLIAERDAGHPLVATVSLALSAGTMTRRDASSYIDALQHSVPVTKAPVRTNKWPGNCYDCGGPVAVGDGRIEQIDGRWRTFHLADACLTDDDKELLAATAVCEPGVYAKDGAFYRVRKGRYDKSTFWAEKIHTSSAGVSFSRAGQATFLKATDRLDWKTARKLGIMCNACVNCGRHLDDPPSVVAGYGKRCSETCGWPYPNRKQAEAHIAGVAEWDPE